MNLTRNVIAPYTRRSLTSLPTCLRTTALFLAVVALASPLSAVPIGGAKTRALRAAQARPAPAAVPVNTGASGAQLTTVHVFASTTGLFPTSTLAVGADGSVYGTTRFGGTFDEGTVFRLAPDGTYTVLHNFGAATTDGLFPRATVTPAPDGFLYGTTSEGGTAQSGTFFRLDPATGRLDTLASFVSTTGTDPISPVVTDGHGNFYGAAQSGGVNQAGTLYVYNVAAGTLTDLVDFSESTGSLPEGAPLLAPDGNLYGVTNNGGPSNGTNSPRGTIYQCQPATRTLNVIFTFDGATFGENPTGPLATDGQGNFYGLSSQLYNNTVLAYRFTVDPAVNPPAVTPTVIHTFSNVEAYELQSGLLRGVDGNLYGTINADDAGNYGYVFQLLPNTPDGTGNLATANILHGFTANDRFFESATLASDAVGNLYGTSDNGGGENKGFLFKLSPVAATAPAQYTFAVPVTFLLPDGEFPTTPLTLGGDGNLYGVTGGGIDSIYALFVYSPATGLTTTLYTFNYGSSLGFNPLGGLVRAAADTFYGVTSGGGTNNMGTIFRLTTAMDPATGAVAGTVDFVYSFPAQNTGAVNIAFPQVGLTLAPDGTLYGIAGGGTSNDSVIFRFDPVADTVTPLASLSEDTTGDSPVASLTLAGDGNFYGTTQYGAIQDEGTLFRFNPVTGNLAVLVNFDDKTTGLRPMGALLPGSDGNLYGTTSSGGPVNGGFLFEFVPATGQLIPLLPFDDTTGVIPSGSLVQAPDGNFYGTLQYGGAAGQESSNLGAGGVVYQYNPDNGAFRRLVDFSLSGGYRPEGGLTLAADGTLYGTTAGEEEGTEVDDLAAGPVRAVAGLTGPFNDEYGTIFHVVVDPTFTSATVASGTLNQSFSFQVTATFASGGYTAAGLPAGLSINAATGLISGAPTVAGVFPATISARDTTDAATQTLTIFIQNPAAPLPVVTSAALPPGALGVAYSYQVTANNGPATFAAAGLPAGLTIDPVSGLLARTPTAAGAFPVTLSATNANGTGAPVTLTLTVTAPPVVTVAAVGDAEAVEGGAAGKVIFQRTGDLSAALTVSYKVRGDAEAGVDYKMLPGTATIPAGAAQVKIKIKPVDNTTADGTRKVKVKLLPSPNGSYTLGTATVAAVKILDND